LLSSLVLSTLFQPDFGVEFLDGSLKDIVWLNFSGRAALIFQRVSSFISTDPSDYKAYFLRASCYGWFIAPNPANRRYDNPLLESLEACIDYAARVEEDSSEYGKALYFKALAMVVQARFKAIRGYKFSSRWATRGAKDAAEKLVEKFPDEIDAALPLAIFHAFWGGSPIWARIAQVALLVPRGDRKRGIRMLEQIAENGDDSKLWASLALLNIYSMNPHSTHKALEVAQQLHYLFPDNALFQLTLGDCYRSLGRWVLAEGVYQSILAKVKSRLPGNDEDVCEISRLRAVECQINLGKMQEAFEGVKGILTSNPINPEWVVPWAHLYAARIYRYRGDLKRAERALRYALEGRDIDKLHKAANQELEAVRKELKKQEEK